MYVYIYTYEVYTKGGLIDERRVGGGEYIKKKREEHVESVAYWIIRSDNSINRFPLSEPPTSVHVAQS